MTKKLEQLKPVIERLYVKEGKPLNEVRSLIKANFGFEVCVRTYKNAFEKWGWKKYNRRSRFSTYTVEEKDTRGGTELEAIFAVTKPLTSIFFNIVEFEPEDYMRGFQIVMCKNLKNFRKQILKTWEDLRILRELSGKKFPETTTVCPICDTILAAQGGIMAKCENPGCKMITAEENGHQGMQIIQPKAAQFSIAPASTSSRIEEAWEEDNTATFGKIIEKVPKAVSADMLDIGFTLEPVPQEDPFNLTEISFPVFPSQTPVQVESYTPPGFNEWPGQTMIHDSPNQNFGSNFSPNLSSSMDNGLGWTCWNQLCLPTYTFNYPASTVPGLFPLSGNAILPTHSASGFNPLFSNFSPDYNYLPPAGDPLYSINTSTFQVQNDEDVLYEDVLQNKTYTWPNSDMSDAFLV